MTKTNPVSLSLSLSLSHLSLLLGEEQEKEEKEEEEEGVYKVTLGESVVRGVEWEGNRV